MKLNKRFCFALLGVSLIIAGCGKAEENDFKKEPTAEPTKVAEATTKPAATAEPTATPTPTPTSFEANSDNSGTTVLNPDGSVATPNPDKKMPDLSEFVEGAYISEDGTEILFKHEDGSIEILWNSFDVDIPLKDEPEPVVDFSIPTVISKESEYLAIVDSNGEIIESLDSTDEDYIKVYATEYGYCNALLLNTKISVKSTFDNLNKFLVDDYKYTENDLQQELKENGEYYKYNEKFDVFEVFKAYFNKDRTYCRVYVSKEVSSDETGTFICEGRKNEISNLKLVNGKWLICSPDEIPSELVKILPLE
jgi:hypothetical protein